MTADLVLPNGAEPPSLPNPLIRRFRNFRNKVKMLQVGKAPFVYSYLRYQHREFLAEFIGTLILVLLIDGVAAEQTLNIGPKSWLTSSFGTGDDPHRRTCICSCS